MFRRRADRSVYGVVGPIAKPEDATFVLERCKGVHGFFGASSMERLPVEEAITGITKTFKDIAIRS